MSQELTDAEWLRRAAVTLTLADKGYAPGHSLPEIVSALRSIADRLERPGVEAVTYRLVGGPRDGQVAEASGSLDRFGMLASDDENDITVAFYIPSGQRIAVFDRLNTP